MSVDILHITDHNCSWFWMLISQCIFQFYLESMRDTEPIQPQGKRFQNNYHDNNQDTAIWASHSLSLLLIFKKSLLLIFFKKFLFLGDFLQKFCILCVCLFKQCVCWTKKCKIMFQIKHCIEYEKSTRSL